MYLEEFVDYKNQLVTDMLKNPEIVRLLSDKYEQNVPEDPKTLFRSQIFPYEFVPETLEHGRTIICFEVEISKLTDRMESRAGKMMYTPTVYIWVFTHKSLMWIPDVGVRVDRIAIEIAKSICGSHDYGAGSLTLASTRRVAPTMDYQGTLLTFKATDWNMPKPTGKSWPSNRKAGI